MQGETINPPSQSTSDPAVALPDPNTPAQKNHNAHREKLRQGYLATMGIQTWFPRYQLTNALPPRPFDWIAEDVKAFAQGDTATSLSDNEAAVGQHRVEKPYQPGYAPTKPADILGQFMPAAQPAEKARPTEQPAPQTRPIGAISKFRLVIQPISEECLVIAEMPHSGLNQFSRYHQRLLNDMLKSLRLNPDSPQPGFREFVWPMTGSRGLLSQLSQDDHAAADAVSAYLSNQYGLSRRKVILLLGQSAARFVMDPEKNFEQLRGVHQGTHAEQWFVVTHGLNELMKQPVLKREAWQDIAPITTFPTSPNL